MELTGLKYEKKGPVGIVSFNRPETLNAMDTNTVDEMKWVLGEIDKDTDIRCVILTGAGAKSFSAGGDINEEADKDVLSSYEFAKNGAMLLEMMERFRVPIIAAINGYALGGGLEFAIACDIRIASEKAKLGSPEITLGVYPGWGGTQRLPRIVGMSKAKLIMFTGGMYSAQESLEMGLVDKVVPPESLMDECMALAEKISAQPPLAINYIKSVVYDGMQCDLQRALQLEAAMFAHLYFTDDMREAYTAYLEKRPPKPYTGR